MTESAIAELMTASTDGILAAVGGICAWLLARAVRRSTVAVTARRFWVIALAMTAIAAAVGGVWHGRRAALGYESFTALDIALWKTVLFAAGASSLALIVAAAWATLAERARRVALRGAAVLSVVYLVWVGGHDDFLAVVLGSGLALLTVAGLHAWRWNLPGSRSIVAAVAVAVAGGGAQAAGWGIHPVWLDHNVVYHLIETVALVLFYRGARQVLDFPGASPDERPAP